MPSTKYTSIIAPNVLQIGDTVRIKGVLLEDATEFSINFVNDICKNPDFITYHFKLLLDENFIVENYKDNGEWVHHLERSIEKLDGSVFELEFSFQEGLIDVYKIYDNTPNHITSYETYFEISDIKSVQVWGDVKKILEINYKYA